MKSTPADPMRLVSRRVVDNSFFWGKDLTFQDQKIVELGACERVFFL